MDDERDNTLLVGVNVGGDLSFKEMTKNTDHDYTLSLSPSTGMKVLEQRYQREFHLLKPNESSFSFYFVFGN